MARKAYMKVYKLPVARVYRLPVRNALREAMRLHRVGIDTGNRYMQQSTRLFIQMHWRKRNTGVFVELKSSL